MNSNQASADAEHLQGSNPSMVWRNNPDGEVRTLEEAEEIARKHGVEIPDDVQFFQDELNVLEGTIYTARGPGITRAPGGEVSYKDHYNINGKVPITVRNDIFASDEAIVAVFAHEVHEIRGMKIYMKESGGSVSFEEYMGHHHSNNQKNLHWEAWEIADDLVRKMRGE